MDDEALQQAHAYAKKIVENLVAMACSRSSSSSKMEKFISVKVCSRPTIRAWSPLPHQNLSQCALPPESLLQATHSGIVSRGAAAAAAILAEGDGVATYQVNPDALATPDTDLRLFGKQSPRRRPMGVALALGETTEQARERAVKLAEGVEVTLS